MFKPAYVDACPRTKFFFCFSERTPGRPGKSQKEGQEDQRTLKALGAPYPSLVLLASLLALTSPPCIFVFVLHGPRLPSNWDGYSYGMAPASQLLFLWLFLRGGPSHPVTHISYDEFL